MNSITNRIEKLERQIGHNGCGGQLTDGIPDFHSWVAAIQGGSHSTVADPGRLTFAGYVSISALLDRLIKRKKVSEQFGSNKPIDSARFAASPFSIPVFQQAVRSATGRKSIKPKISAAELQKISDAFGSLWKKYSSDE